MVFASVTCPSRLKIHFDEASWNEPSIGSGRVPVGTFQTKPSLIPICLPTSFKVDVFVSRQRPFDVTAMDRATMEQLGDNHLLEIRVATAADAIISKLEWYRKTNETSERQWDDVTRLLKLLGGAADMEYLNASAESIDVLDLLERLLATL